MARRSLIGWMADLDPAQEHRLAVWISETFPFIPHTEAADRVRTLGEELVKAKRGDAERERQAFRLLERINRLVSRG